MPPPQSTSTSPMTRSAPMRSPTHRSCQQDSESAEEATPTSQTVRESQAPTLTPEPARATSPRAEPSCAPSLLDGGNACHSFGLGIDEDLGTGPCPRRPL